MPKDFVVLTDNQFLIEIMTVEFHKSGMVEGCAGRTGSRVTLFDPTMPLQYIEGLSRLQRIILYRSPTDRLTALITFGDGDFDLPMGADVARSGKRGCQPPRESMRPNASFGLFAMRRKGRVKQSELVFYTRAFCIPYIDGWTPPRYGVRYTRQMRGGLSLERLVKILDKKSVPPNLTRGGPPSGTKGKEAKHSAQNVRRLLSLLDSNPVAARREIARSSTSYWDLRQVILERMYLDLNVLHLKRYRKPFFVERDGSSYPRKHASKIVIGPVVKRNDEYYPKRGEFFPYLWVYRADRKPMVLERRMCGNTIHGIYNTNGCWMLGRNFLWEWPLEDQIISAGTAKGQKVAAPQRVLKYQQYVDLYLIFRLWYKDCPKYGDYVEGHRVGVNRKGKSLWQPDYFDKECDAALETLIKCAPANLLPELKTPQERLAWFLLESRNFAFYQLLNKLAGLKFNSEKPYAVLPVTRERERLAQGCGTMRGEGSSKNPNAWKWRAETYTKNILGFKAETVWIKTSGGSARRPALCDAYFFKTKP